MYTKEIRRSMLQHSVLINDYQSQHRIQNAGRRP